MTDNGPVVGGLWQGEYLLQASLGDPTHEVFRAQRRSDSQTVAIRFWRAPNDALAAQFVEFASPALALRHPSLAQAEAAGREGHYCYLASEYVVGQKLDTWADQVGIPPLGDVIDLTRRLCEGLSVATRSGVHHSALHPRNVVMMQSESPNRRRAQPKLLDLGWPTFARPRTPHALAAQFMPPEQLASVLEASHPPLPLTNASMNVYSCGALLYYLCTGGPPYRHAELAMLRDAQLQGRLVLPSRINPQITPSLNAVIIQALSLDPKARFASVAELAEALVRVSLTPSVANARPVLSSVPPRAGSVPPRASGPSRASAVGLKRISAPAISIPPGFPHRPPPAATEFSAEEAETGRLAAITQRPPANAPQPEEVSEERERNSVPAGSFSSHPPPRSSAPPKPMRGVVATPVALFSGAPHERSGVESHLPPRQLDLGPGQILAQHEAITARPPRGGKRSMRRWAIGTAVLAGALLIGIIRLRNSALRATAEQTPTVTVVQQPADQTPVQPEPIAEPPTRRRNESEYAAREPDPEVVPEDEVPSLDIDATPTPRSQRSRSARTSATGASPTSRDSRGTSSLSAAAAARESREAGAAPARAAEATPSAAPAPSPPLPEAPAHAAEPEQHASKPARAAELAAETPAPAPAPAAPVAASRPAPEPEVKLPLEAKASIGDVTLRGALPTSWVKRAVERLLPQFAGCYGRAAQAAGKNQFGSVTVEVEFDERGRARNPRARGGKLPGLNECVAEAASKVISERAPDTGTVHASFKVSFSP